MTDLLENDWPDTPTQAPKLSALEQVAVEGKLLERARVETLMVPDVPEATLLDIFARPAWMAEAACRGMGTAAFFPERGRSIETARAVCERCQVRQQCLEATLADSDTVGVWGGLSDRGRKLLRRGAA